MRQDAGGTRDSKDHTPDLQGRTADRDIDRRYHGRGTRHRHDFCTGAGPDRDTRRPCNFESRIRLGPTLVAAIAGGHQQQQRTIACPPCAATPRPREPLNDAARGGFPAGKKGGAGALNSMSKSAAIRHGGLRRPSINGRGMPSGLPGPGAGVPAGLVPAPQLGFGGGIPVVAAPEGVLPQPGQAAYQRQRLSVVVSP
jgi:hypothetical protein